MAFGLLGKKIGMTRVFTENGRSIPVTVIEVPPNRVASLRTVDKNGYTSVQVTYGSKKKTNLTKPVSGCYQAVGIEAGEGLCEFRLSEEEIKNIEIGAVYKVDVFQAQQKVDVTAKSKGKGFAGTVKRYNFSTQDASHGNSLSHRVPGSIGQTTTPGRVWKGKKMPGRLGGKRCTLQTLEVVRVDQERNILMVKGSVPGPCSQIVKIRPANKTLGSKEVARGK